MVSSISVMTFRLFTALSFFYFQWMTLTSNIRTCFSITRENATWIQWKLVTCLLKSNLTFIHP